MQVEDVRGVTPVNYPSWLFSHLKVGSADVGAVRGLVYKVGVKIILEHSVQSPCFQRECSGTATWCCLCRGLWQRGREPGIVNLSEGSDKATENSCKSVEAK
jgi:hypothetical protein